MKRILFGKKGRTKVGKVSQRVGGVSRTGQRNATRNGIASEEDRKKFERKLQIITDRMAEWPQSVDALIFVFNLILQNPEKKKFKSINTTKKQFVNSIGLCGHWGPDLLKHLGFEESEGLFTLHSHRDDPAKLFMAKSALENVQKSELYLFGKEKISFYKEAKKSVDNASAEEIGRRKEFQIEVPREPEKGSAGYTYIRVYFGESAGTGGSFYSRAFYSDNSLENVLMWLGANVSSVIPEKLDQGEWELVDLTEYPHKIINMSEKNRVLKYLKLWPSGVLDIQPAGFLEKEKKLNGIIDNKK